MFTSISIDTYITKNNQNVSTECSNEYIVDPFSELVNIISSCSAVGFPRFIIHKAKTNLVVSIESLSTTYLLDISTLLYVITLIGALTSIRVSVSTYQNATYFFDVNKKTNWTFTYDSKASKIYQLCCFTLITLSIIIPMFIYNNLNSQIIL